MFIQIQSDSEKQLSVKVAGAQNCKYPGIISPAPALIDSPARLSCVRHVFFQDLNWTGILSLNKRHRTDLYGRLKHSSNYLDSIFFFSATPSVKYGSRNNSGEVVFTFNPSGTDPQQIIQQHTAASGLTVQHADQKAALLKSYKYMFQKQADKAAGRLITGTINSKGFNNTISIPNNLTKIDN